MKSNQIVSSGILLCGLVILAGCKPSEPPKPETPDVPPLAKTTSATASPTNPAGQAELPPNHPPIAGLPPGHPPMTGRAGQPATGGMPEQGDTGTGETIEPPTQFAGISLTPPKDWVAMKPAGSGGGIAGPVAIFVLPSPDKTDTSTTARLTHFPGMRNIPVDMNLQRWYGTLVQPDGSATRDVAKRDDFEIGGATITMVDFTGQFPTGGKQQPLMRMIAAEIKHPAGPHYLKVLGPEATIAANRDAVEAYLKSVKITE